MSAKVDKTPAELAQEEALAIIQKAKEEADAMLAKAQEASAAMLKAQEGAKVSAKDEASAKPKLPAAVQALMDADEELVEVELFFDGSKYKDDVFVAVNGESCQIRRGEKVKIKRKFARVIEQGKFQDAAAQRLREKLAAEFAQASKERGLA